MVPIFARLALIGSAMALPLSGCDDGNRSEADPPAPEPVEVSPSPAAEETPVASIIRPEIVAEAVPPEPLARLEATIPFQEGYEVGEAAVAALAPVLESEQFAEGWPIVLRGHTDSTGSDEANLRVSRRRAEAVADWLEARGADPARITVIPIGEQRPVAPNARLDGTPDPAGRARNRRVTLTLEPPAEQPSAPADRDRAAGAVDEGGS